MLEWSYLGEGEWIADSLMHYQMNNFQWNITIRKDGTFDISDSDHELFDGNSVFQTLSEAKYFCESKEKELVESCKYLAKSHKTWQKSVKVISEFLQAFDPMITKEIGDHNAKAIIAKLSHEGLSIEKEK